MGFARVLYGQGYMRKGESKGMGRGLKVGFGGLYVGCRGLGGGKSTKHNC